MRGKGNRRTRPRKGRGRQKRKEGQARKINRPEFGCNWAAPREAFLFIGKGFSRYFQGVLVHN
jgi:hypothetical protein